MSGFDPTVEVEGLERFFTDLIATQTVNTRVSGIEPNTKPTVNNGFVPNNWSNPIPPTSARMIMTSVKHPTSPPIATKDKLRVYCSRSGFTGDGLDWLMSGA